MTQSDSALLVPPNFDQEEYICVTPQSAGWEHLSFAARKMQPGQQWSWDSGENEIALTVLGGKCSVHSSRGDWENIGRRPNVFSGMPYTLYLPRDTQFTVKAVNELDIAYGWAKAWADNPARLITPDQVEIEIRGGDNVTRQINKMIPPGSTASRLVVVEVYTPSGNWSSYPPHKHDQVKKDAQGNLLEADLEEVYFYKIDKPEGYAYQRIYTPDGRIDELMLARDSYLVLSPEGYHPVVSAPGYTTYYLNYLAGSAQSLAASDDPQYAWVKSTWRSQDPRLPVVDRNMEKE